LVVSKEVVLQVKADRIKYKFMSGEQNAGQFTT